MKSFKTLTTKLLFLAAFVTPVIFSLNVRGDDQLPDDVKQVWTSVEGNIIYYVKEGEKVKKGDPLFFVVTSDNNPALYFKIQSEVIYQRKLFKRRKDLVQTRAVSKEEYDAANQSLVGAESEMISYLTKVSQGFYVAPFDCEIVKLLYVQGSGIGDGNPAINIKCTDKDYVFEPPKPNETFKKIIELSDQWVKSRMENYNVKDFKELVGEN